MDYSGNSYILILAYIILFLHGLKGFSKELQEVGSDYLKRALQKVASHRALGFLFGAGLTSIIQSSSAVTSITVAMVDAGVFSFHGSLAVMLGANVGTTATSWLVSYKLTGMGPAIIVLGAFISFLPYKIKLIGNSLFYFGFILFSLDLISSALKPLQNEPFLKELLSNWSTPYLGVIGGMIATAIVQSSSVVSGLAILLNSYGFITVEDGVGIVLGAIVGTTTTALIASTQLEKLAKLAAIANFIFNFTGVLILLPFLHLLSDLAQTLTGTPEKQIALAHSIISGTIALSFLWLTPKMADLLIKWRFHGENPETSNVEHPDDDLDSATHKPDLG